MSVPLTLLGLLDREPSHGYDLKREYDSYFGRGKPIPFGQVYATLARLARDGKVLAAKSSRALDRTASATASPMSERAKSRRGWPSPSRQNHTCRPFSSSKSSSRSCSGARPRSTSTPSGSLT